MIPPTPARKEKGDVAIIKLVFLYCDGDSEDCHGIEGGDRRDAGVAGEGACGDFHSVAEVRDWMKLRGWKMFGGKYYCPECEARREKGGGR